MNAKLEDLRAMAKEVQEEYAREFAEVGNLAKGIIAYIDELEAREPAFKLAQEAALRVVNQPHYFQRVPCGALSVEILGVSKSDLVTDIAHEIGLAILRERGGA